MGTRSGARPGYQTGNEYPATDEPVEDGRDIYGEDDPLPEDLAGGGSPLGDEDDEVESTRAGPPRKLVILAGPEKGKVKRLTGVRMVIGRATGCHIQVEDRSISRRHLELIQGEKGVLLRDLVSGNGTKVNGERVDEKLLRHEDVIEIGATKLQFVDELEAVKKAREEADRKQEESRRSKEEREQRKQEEAAAALQKAEDDAKRAEEEKKAAEEARYKASLKGRWESFSLQQRIGAIGGSLLAVILIWVVLSTIFREAVAPPPDARELAATRKMDGARVAMMDGRFGDAVDLIESAERIKAGIDEDNLGDVARKELAAIKSLELARSLVEQQRFDDARAELARTPEASEKRILERQALEQEILSKQADYLERSAQEALDALDPATAAQFIEQLPDERKTRMKGRLEEVEALVQKQQQMDQARSSADRQRNQVRAVQARKAFVDNAFRPVERKFHAMDFPRAVLECDRVVDAYRGDEDIRSRARTLKTLIPTFARSWEDAQKKVRARAMESALRPLQKAHSLYQQIALPGSLGDLLDEQLADAQNAAAKAAVARNDLGTATQLYRDILRRSPGDERARQGLTKMGQRADELYLEAYMIRERDPKQSIAKLKLVMQVAPRGSDAHQKAESQLRLMEP
ncbi:MAG: FHA domain-containing protein [Myxococcota bacterium]|nr:FHA domain-containing protein [Myxococcota bacterium]